MVRGRKKAVVSAEDQLTNGEVEKLLAEPFQEHQVFDTVKPAHSPLGASNCERWWNCPGSVHLIKQAPPETPNEDAAKGTCVHKMAEIKLRDLLTGTHEWDYFKGSKISADGFNFRVDDRMLEGMQCYVDYMMEIKENHPSCTIWLEHGVTITDELYGRSDAVVLIPFDSIHAIDYKNGYGEVPVEGNKQGLYYLLGCFLGLPQHVRDELQTASITIVQPNGASGNKIKSWSIPIDELKQFHKDLLDAATRTYILNKPELHAGDWCKWCPAQVVCPEYQAAKLRPLQTIVTDFDAMPVNGLPKPINLTPLEMANILYSIKPSIESYFTAVHDHVTNILQNGTDQQKATLQAAGFKFEVGRQGNRYWVDEEQTKQALIQAGVHTKTPILKTELLSPSKMETALEKSGIEFDLSTYYDRDEGKKSLKWESPIPLIDFTQI